MISHQSKNRNLTHFHTSGRIYQRRRLKNPTSREILAVALKSLAEEKNHKRYRQDKTDMQDFIKPEVIKKTHDNNSDNSEAVEVFLQKP